MTASELRAALKRHFGFDDFLEEQEDAVRNVLAGRHSLLLMPTGGGKSLCYQLPAVLRDGVALVVSPLIALMKDQVDALNANGVAARCVNSNQPAHANERAMQEARQGLLKLLYVAPERLALDRFRRLLHGMPVSLIAVDEAHCISEWGHEFRPDYRTLQQVRGLFPDAPVIAATATATERVREDIVQQLGIADAQRFVSSFNRPNLTYSVVPKDAPVRQVAELLAERKGEAAIIYCLSRNDTEDMAAGLSAAGIPAKAYHAGMDAETRRRVQEDFSRDRVPVIAATIAFGMGIDKPDVRLVVHTSLPKSVEGYYQETGRAGRDGLPSECVLLYSYGDKARQDYFVRQIEDEGERRNAQVKLDQMVEYAQLPTCRRRYLLRYFGEAWDAEDCGACDVCLAADRRGTFDATEIAQKLLSAVARTGERYGATHVIRVVLGSREKRIIDAGHDQLSVYGIVRDYDRNQLREIVDMLRAKGLVELNEGEYATLRLTDAGHAFLRNRDTLLLPNLQEQGRRERQGRPAPGSAAPVSYDAGLFEALRALRRRIADEQSVPSFVVFGDVALRHMAASIPRTPEAFLAVPGVGQAKLQAYGDAFLAAIRGYAEAHGLALPEAPARDGLAPPRRRDDGYGERRPRRSGAQDAVRALLDEGKSVDEIAQLRGIQPTTVVGHIERMSWQGASPPVAHLALAPERMAQIESAMRACGSAPLRPVWEYLEEAFTFDELRIARVVLRQQGRLPQEDA